MAVVADAHGVELTVPDEHVHVLVRLGWTVREQEPAPEATKTSGRAPRTRKPKEA